MGSALNLGLNPESMYAFPRHSGLDPESGLVYPVIPDPIRHLGLRKADLENKFKMM